jgi:hypothetical protein
VQIRIQCCIIYLNQGKGIPRSFALRFNDIINELKNLDAPELATLNKAVVTQAKILSNHNSALNKAKFSVGDQVKFRGRYSDEIGTIKRIKTKKAIIDTGASRNWDVPLSLLSAV